MQKKFLVALLTIALCIQVALPSFNVLAARTIYDNETGTQDGYNFELWKDYGTTSMTLNEAGTFSCQWSNIGNALFRKGVKFDSTKTYQQIGNINIEYGCDYKPNGNSYLCVYGWTEDPLVEYYIVESWGTWRPPGADRAKGQITVDGGTYDVYETTRVNQPSIHGNTTFQQYWSVRTSKRTSGTISVSEHFKAWERMGMKCGKLYEAALNVEGYQSSGSANVYKNIVTLGGNSNSGGNTSGGNTTPATGNKIECEDMTVSGQYAGGINNPFDGVALYANDESCSFTYDFKSDTGDFTLRGCSNNSNMAKVDLIIGGENKGTFYYGNEYPAQYTIEDVTHKTGKQKVELVINSDDGNWDAYTDYLLIDEKNVTTDSGNDSGNNGNDQGESDVVVSNGVKTECENMTLSGRYAGKIDSPFNGVALYANNDSVSFIQDFSEGTHDFTLKGCSNNSNMAKVDLVIGGENKGTFYYGDGYPAEYTIENVNHKTGKQKVELIVNADDGNWDAFLDCLVISGKTSNSSDNESNGSNKPNGKLVALTFDDGPSETTTAKVLDVLQKYDVPATFFLIGRQVNSGTREVMQRQISQGCELACHSYTHEDMSKMSETDVKNQIEWTTSAIYNTVGVNVKYFRAPYLSTSNTMFQNINLSFIQGIDCGDWQSNVSAYDRANTILNNVSDGTIILMHDFEGNDNTVQALPTIIEGLKKQGYTFVTVSQLFEYKNVNPNVGYKVWSNVLN